MRAGKLRHMITLQSPTGTRDAVGERTTTWTHVMATKASITPVKSTERFIDPQLKGSITHKLRIRYASEIAAIDTSWRAVFEARVFVINGVRDIEEHHHEIELLCTEGLRTE